MSERLPSLFLGHGNPMNALAGNGYTRAWRQIGEATPRPKAILCVSAHWYVRGTGVTLSAQPRTIHDFGGFPKELFQVEYPAPGSPDLARRVAEVLHPVTVEFDARWGLDHGTWAVLCHVYPAADIPVVQLSIDATRPPLWHYDVGRRLASLREEGILIVGSGNLIHNLRAYAWGQEDRAPYDWAQRFETQARELLVSGEHQPLIGYPGLGQDAMLSIPTPEHYLPLLYVLGTRQEAEEVVFPVSGIEGGSVSMLAVQVGGL